MINSVSASSTPLSTRVIQSAGEAAEQNVVDSQTDPSVLNTPENINTVVDAAQDGVQQRQQTQQAEQDAVRNLALEVNQYQQQQELIDIYQSQSSGADESSSNTNVYNVADLAQNKTTAERLETAGNVIEAKDKYSDAITPSEPSFFHIQA